MRLLHIPKGLFKLLIFLILLAVGVGFALVRTQGGRDLLSSQIELAFSKAFAGSLEIGRLEGNILGTLYAIDVNLRDPAGQVVIHVDTLVAGISIFDALQRDVTIRTAELVHPTVVAVRNADGAWNLSAVFRKKSEDSESGSQWKLKSADVKVRGGRIQTVNHGSKPSIVESGYLFDYTNTRYEDVHGRLTVDWGESDRLVDVINLGGRATATEGGGGVDITDFHGQLVATDSTVALAAARLETRFSVIELAAGLSGFEGFSALIDGSSEEKTIRARVDAPRIDSTEIALLFPSIHIPNASFTAELEGSRGDLRVTRFAIQVGDNTAAGSASVRGLPEFAEFLIDIENSTINPHQLALLIGDAASDVTRRTPEQHITAMTSGRVERGDSGSFSNVVASLSFQAESRLGILDGNVDFRDSEGDTASYHVGLDFFDFRVGQLAPELARNSVWNGYVAITGSGTRFDELNVAAELELSQSSIRNLMFESINARMNAVGRSIQVDLEASGPSGDIRFTSLLDFSTPAALFDATASTSRFELVRAITGHESDSRSEFTIRSHVTARGSSIDDISGFLSIAIDTVSFFSAEDTVGLPPSEHLIELSHGSNRETNLTLRGDVLEGELEGVYTFSTISKVASLWLGAAFRTLKTQMDKRLHVENIEDSQDGDGNRDERAKGSEFETAGPDLTVTQTLHLREKNEAATFLNERGFHDGIHFTGGFRVNRMLDLSLLVGGLPSYAAGLEIRTAGRISADNIDVQTWVNADSLRGAAAEFDGLRGQISISGVYDGVLEEFVDSDVSFTVGRIGLGSDKISDLSLQFHYANRAGSLTVESRNEMTDSLSVGLEAELAVLSDRNEIVVSDAFLRRIDYAWRLAPDAVFDVFGDAVRISGFSLVSQYSSDADRPPQRVALTGVVSGHFADTLAIEAANVSLDQISDLVDLRDHLGGEIDASIAVAHVLRRPEVVGDMVVRRLSYVGRDVGDLRISSTYSGQGESLFIDAEIHQPREEGPLIKGYDARVSGTIAIPGPDSDVPFGALDIRLDATGVELFFFEILFSNELRDVSGKAAGSGTITGVLTKPVFNVDIQILESDFLSPEFNLRLGITGRVTVDSLGFHLHDALLTDPTGGRATIRGSLLFNDYRFFSFDLSADLEELMIMNVKRSEDLAFYGEVWVSGSATLTGPLQRTLLRSTDIVTSQRSRLYMPVTDDKIESDQTFIVFTDSTGEFEVKKRRFMLDARPANERAFIDGMDMSFNITIPSESNVFLVFDALLGEVIDARGTGRIQFLRTEGEYAAFGTLTLSSGSYLFTAGEVFQRRFVLDAGGTITWDGDPVDAALAIPATYRARASLAGLPGQNPDIRVPIRVIMNLSGRLSTPEVELRIALDVDQREGLVIPPGLEVAFNREDLAAEYATSVLLTNTFLLTSSSSADPAGSADDLLFNSLSHLISSQLNRFVSQALDLDVNVGVQQGRSDNAYDLVYEFALRLEDQGLVIRGEGLYETTTAASSSEGLQGEFVVEYLITPNVRLELFFRRETDLYSAASTLGTSYGTGLVYQTDFANWKSFGRKREQPVDSR